MLITSIYLLLDRERITPATLCAVPATIRNQTVELFHAVQSSLVKYLRAQLLLCVIMGAIGVSVAYFTFGRYALLIGLWVRVTEIVPMIGSFLGVIPAVVPALFSGGFTQSLLVAALFLVTQQLEGNVLQPRIMGGSVGVHPLWVLFVTLATTALYGVIGAVFTVSIIAVASRYLRETLLFERWRKALVTELTFIEGEPAASSAEVVASGEKPASLRGFSGERG
jgi:predicted PurR-regulated permease PerM